MTERFDVIWARVKQHQNEPFQQKRGGEFSYTIDGNYVVPDRTNRQLPKTDLERAWNRLPVTGPGELQDRQGPSYLWAILVDGRIA